MRIRIQQTNPDDASTYALVIGGLATGAAIGIGLMYALSRTDKGADLIGQIKKSVDDSGIRLPEPGIAMVLPSDEASYTVLDEVICECATPIIESASDEATIEEIVGQIQSCVAKALYPNFPWPPMAGDHPSISQLWNEIGVIARRSIITGTICPEQ